MKVIGIVGSLRKESYNLKLANIIKNKLKDIDMEIITLENIPLFNEDIEYPAPSSVSNLRVKIKESDAVWIFSPEYNHSVPGVLKNTIDWLSRPISEDEDQVLSNKKVVLSGTTLGPFGTVNAYNDLVQLFVLLNCKLLTNSRLTIPSAHINVNDNNKYINETISKFKEFIK